MNDNLNISVIIPTHNRAYCIQRAIDSVLAQTYPADEIIIIDDGSTDDTQEIIQQYSHQKIKYIFQPQSGVSAARNSGIKIASGNWIALLDSDDSWQFDKLAKQVEALKHQSELLVCHTDEIWIRNGVRVNQMNKHQKQGGWIFPDCLAMCKMSPSSILMHKSIFDDVGLFDEDLPACEDYDLWLRITAKYPVLYLDEPLITKYGGHEDQLSRKYWGMDRFRIQALVKLLEAGALNVEDEALAIQMLQQKIEVYIQGARKRNKLNEVEYYQDLFNQFIGPKVV